MDITVIMKHPRERGAPAASSLDPILDKYKARLVPLHPGVESPALSRHYALRLPAGADLHGALADLRSHASVDAAYVKPGGEAPE
jgi:hypothetical protein